MLRKTLNKIIPKAGTITVNSLFIPSKGDVAGGISNAGRWQKGKFSIFKNVEFWEATLIKPLKTFLNVIFVASCKS